MSAPYVDPLAFMKDPNFIARNNSQSNGGTGGYGDARDNPNNTMGVFYDPSKKQGDVSGYYYDYNNPSLQVNQNGQASSMGAAGIKPGSAGDPTWNPSAIYTDPSSQFYQPPAQQGQQSAAQQAYGGQYDALGKQLAGMNSGAGAYGASAQGGYGGASDPRGNPNDPRAYQGPPGTFDTAHYGPQPAPYSQQGGGAYPGAFPSTAGQMPTSGGYSPTAPGNPGQLQNNTWWGDPAQASLENAFGQYGQNFLNPTNTQQLNASNPFAQPLQGEALGRSAGAMYGNTTNSQNALGALTSQLDQPSELAQNSGGIAGKIGQANNSQGYLQQIGQQLGGPGALEQFAATSLAGDNPYYARLAKQGRDAINQEAIARGAYGADGTLAALGNYQAATDAQNYQAQAQLQQAAQAAQQARLGLGGSLSQAADSSALNQGNALSSLYQNMFGDRMQAAGLGIQGNSAADSSQIARLAGLTNMVNNGDQTTLARLSGQAGLANQADTSGLNSLNSYFNQAGNAQQAGGQRINSQLDRGLQEALAQAGLYGGFYGQGGSQSVDAGTAGANAGANAAQLTGQGQNSGVNNLINIFSALMGGGSKK